MTTFDIPADYQMPDGVNVGDEFEEVCTLKFTDDGKIMILAVDGNTIGKAEEKERRKPMGMKQKMTQVLEADNGSDSQQPE